MSRAEGIHDKNITKRCIGFRQHLIILFLASVKAHILQQYQLPILLDTLLPIANKRYLSPQQDTQPVGHRLQGKLGIKLPFDRTSKMGHQDDRGTGLERQFNGG